MDQIKVGLTGNLAGFTFTDSSGKAVSGAGVDYNGAPTGYAAAPGEAVEYLDAHDNADLFDALAYKLPQSTSPADRARMQALGLSLTALTQGPGFAQAGSDLLRSKSLDANSYDSVTGSTRSTGTAGRATAGAAVCRWRPTTARCGPPPSPCWPTPG